MIRRGPCNLRPIVILPCYLYGTYQSWKASILNGRTRDFVHFFSHLPLDKCTFSDKHIACISHFLHVCHVTQRDLQNRTDEIHVCLPVKSVSPWLIFETLIRWILVRGVTAKQAFWFRMEFCVYTLILLCNPFVQGLICLSYDKSLIAHPHIILRTVLKCRHLSSFAHGALKTQARCLRFIICVHMHVCC